MFTPTASPSSKSASSHNNPATADDSCSSSESLGLLYSSPVDHPSRKRRLPSNSSLETKERSVDHLSSSCSSEKSAGEPVNRASRSSSAGTNVDSRSPTKRPRVSSGGSLVSWILPGMKSAMSWFSFSPKNTTKERLVECNGTSGKIPEYDDGSDPQTIVRNSTERHSKGKETVGDHGKTDEASSIVPHEQSESRVSSSLTSGSPKSKISNLNQGAGLLPKIQEYQVAPGSPVIFGSSLNDTLGSRGSAAYRRPSYQPARSRLSGIQYEPDLLAPRTTLRIRKPTFSILAKERSNRMMTAMSNLVMRSIPTYQDAAATGYKGTSSDYEGLVAYAEKVYRATAPKSPTKVSESTQETPQKLATPRQNTVGRYQSRLVGSFISRTQQEETVGEEPWIKQLREKIEAALRGHVDERGIVHQTAIATPTYDRLVKQDLEITGQVL
ncbi:hypothetical protein BJ742DRAFT_80674 [Cladochytrium replicatum]|nr:hypothetical protein BJ742DRAFT_80674 [Cladochytrium replicatum]